MQSPAITRRAAIVGALLSTAALAVPASAALNRRSSQASALLDAIAHHKKTMREVRRLGRLIDRLEQTPGRVFPKVRYAWLLKGRDADGNDVREPLYAYSHEQIDQEVDRDIHSRRNIWGPHLAPKAEARANERRQAMHRELTTLIRRKRALDRRIGLAQAEAMMTAAYDAEAVAAATVLMTRPGNAVEAEIKRRYLARRTSGWWDADDVHRALLSACCEIGSV